jgi:hypothetical protein
VIADSLPASLQAEDATPSLADTLAWMDSTYNPHTGEGGSFGHGHKEIYTAGTLFERQDETFKYNGCQLSLQYRDDPNSPLFDQMYGEIIYTFDLHDIDPASITVRQFDSQAGGLSCDVSPTTMTCDIAEIALETRNQVPLIAESVHTTWPHLQGADHEASSSKKTFVTTFFIDDTKYAARFEKALRHAIALCGGKKSTF